MSSTLAMIALFAMLAVASGLRASHLRQAAKQQSAVQTHHQVQDTDITGLQTSVIEAINQAVDAFDLPVDAEPVAELRAPAEPLQEVGAMDHDYLKAKGDVCRDMEPLITAHFGRLPAPGSTFASAGAIDLTGPNKSSVQSSLETLMTAILGIQQTIQAAAQSIPEGFTQAMEEMDRLASERAQKTTELTELILVLVPPVASEPADASDVKGAIKSMLADATKAALGSLDTYVQTKTQLQTEIAALNGQMDAQSKILIDFQNQLNSHEHVTIKAMNAVVTPFKDAMGDAAEYCAKDNSKFFAVGSYAEQRYKNCYAYMKNALQVCSVDAGRALRPLTHPPKKH